MKTNFLNKLKHGLFLLIAILGTFVSFAQSTQNPTIGGSKTPDTGGLLDIGGKQSPPPTPLVNSPVASHSLTKVFEIGGIGGQERRNLAIGRIGGNQVPPRRFCALCVGLSSDIGGQGTTRSYSDIGGNQSPPPRRIYKVYADKEIGGGKGTSSDTGQISYSSGIAVLDTVKVTIGGKDSSGGLGKYSSAVGFQNSIDHKSILEIGDRSTGGEYTISDIGGNRIPSTSLLEIGGQGCPRQFSEIGGSQTPTRSLSDIGGNQGPPRQICDQESSIYFEIGGQGSVPPRSIFEVTLITIPIGGNSVPRA